MGGNILAWLHIFFPLFLQAKARGIYWPRLLTLQLTCILQAVLPDYRWDVHEVHTSWTERGSVCFFPGFCLHDKSETREWVTPFTPSQLLHSPQNGDAKLICVAHFFERVGDSPISSNFGAEKLWRHAVFSSLKPLHAQKSTEIEKCQATIVEVCQNYVASITSGKARLDSGQASNNWLPVLCRNEAKAT